MAKAYYYRRKFDELEPNLKLLENLIKRNPQEYIRKRLKVIKALWEGESIASVKETYKVHPTQYNKWIKTIATLGVDEGLREIAKKMTINRERKLNEEQQRELRDILENKRPYDFGYVGNVFTGKILVDIIKNRFNKEVSDQTVYNLLKHMGYSYQKAHRDYEKADKEEQKKFGEELKKKILPEMTDEKILLGYDEFSLTNRVSCHYGWAQRNSRFKIKCNDSWVERTNGFISIDIINGKEYLKTSKTAKKEDIAEYFYQLLGDIYKDGLKEVIIILDNNPTHKQSMRELLSEKMSKDNLYKNLKITFTDLPPYSPDLNIAEYWIHLMRLKFVHNSPKLKLDTIIENIRRFMDNNSFLSKENISNILQRIFKICAGEI